MTETAEDDGRRDASRHPVLIVEDDGETARLVGEMLEALGHPVAGTVDTGAEAMEEVERLQPSLVLMDIGLAGPMDGVEAAGRIRDRHDVPVVFVTADSDAETLSRAVETNPYGYLTKPFDLRELESTVELALFRHRMEGRLRKKEEHFRLLIENARDIITVLTPEGIIEYESPAVESVLGYRPEERVGREALEFVHDHDLPDARKKLAEALEWPGRTLSVELRVRSAGDRWRILEVVGQAFRNEEGELRVVANSRDITETRKAEAALQASEERFRVLFERNVAGVFRQTLDGIILEVNQAFVDIFGYEDPGELVGRSIWEFCSPAGGVSTNGGGAPDAARAVNRELQLVREDGSVRWLLENSAPTNDPERDEPVIIGTVVDITQRKRLEAEFERLAYHDPLTRLANRRLLADRAQQALARAEREGDGVAMIYLDLDRFKSINDNLGHEAGDRVLVEVARRLRNVTRGSDTVARVGGDEFAVLLPGVEGAEGGVRAARRVGACLDEPVQLEDRTVRVVAQLGVAVYPVHGRDFEGLLRAADQAMYRKKGGIDRNPGWSGRKNGVAVADEMPPADAFFHALEEDQLRLHFQPIHDLRHGRVAGLEALVRWIHPDRGLLTAGGFLPSVDDPVLLRRLDAWVLDEVLHRLWGWDGQEAPWISINLTTASLQDEGFLERLTEVVEGDGTGDGLMVEITEHTAVMDPEATFERLALLRNSGLRIALDDFGTGHASLNYLRHLPVDLLKMDRVFVENVDTDPSSGRVARGIFELGKAAGMTVVAEGVERASQLEWVRRNGCELVQGYHLGRPAPLPPDGREKGPPREKELRT